MLLTIERQKPAELPVPRVVEVILNKGDKGLGISIAGGKGNRHIPDNDGRSGPDQEILYKSLTG